MKMWRKQKKPSIQRKIVTRHKTNNCSEERSFLLVGFVHLLIIIIVCWYCNAILLNEKTMTQTWRQRRKCIAFRCDVRRTEKATSKQNAKIIMENTKSMIPKNVLFIVYQCFSYSVKMKKMECRKPLSMLFVYMFAFASKRKRFSAWYIPPKKLTPRTHTERTLKWALMRERGPRIRFSPFHFAIAIISHALAKAHYLCLWSKVYVDKD